MLKKILKNKTWLWLGLILILAGFFRFWQLASVPPSPSLDEASIGWNAYSILKTGKDEYGYRLPVLLRAYDDWRPALYVYLVIPFVQLLGLTVTAVRLPAVILSLITVLAVYFLVKELLGDFKIALASSSLLAISPWHIYISRLGHEVNAGLTFSVLGILFFLLFINRQKSNFLLGSVIFWELSFYTYQSQKIFGPVMLLVLGLSFKKQLLNFKKEVLFVTCLALVLMLPLIKATLYPGALLRFSGSSIFADQTALQQRSSLRIERDYQQKDYPGLLLDNRRLAMGLVALRAYLSHFDPAWLFFNTGEENHKIPGLGILYLWELPLFLIGIYKLVGDKRVLKSSKILLFGWLLAAPLAASITTDAPHAMRTFNLLPIPQIFTAIGLLELIKKSGKWLALTPILIIFSLIYLYYNYFVNFPHEQSESFQYPLASAIEYVIKNKDQYPKIVFSNQNHCRQSYMFYLFFSRYSPSLYQLSGGSISGGFAEAHVYDKFEFRPIEWGKEDNNTLIIGNDTDFPEDAKIVAKFNLLNKQSAIKIALK
jgi:4-amino-4-deoxy-L-arabinose transferase-like glycosyltransferase